MDLTIPTADQLAAETSGDRPARLRYYNASYFVGVEDPEPEAEDDDE